jgi:hypothetical protein
MKPEKLEGCNLCKRDVALTFHHLVPKSYHTDRRVLKMHDGVLLIHYGIWLCKDCHKTIHKLISLEDLAFKYYSIEELKKHEKLNKFVRWAAKQRKRIKN